MNVVRAKSRLAVLALPVLVLIVLFSMAAGPVREGAVRTGSQGPARAGAESGTMQLYSGTDYKSDRHIVKIADFPKETLNTLRGTTAWHRLSSLKWNLPSEGFVVIYSEEDGTGRQYAIWKSGEDSQLFDNSFDNAAEAWAWRGK